MAPACSRDALNKARRAALIAAASVALPRWTSAGAQVEEPLADAVRSALSAAIAADAPPRPSFTEMEERLAYLRWLGASSERLKKRKSEAQTRIEFLETLWYEAKRAALEPALVLGLIQVESGFRKYAVSVVGARGYMQIMPFWARLIGDGDAAKLFHMQTNLRFGCVILRHYLEREKGDLFTALGRLGHGRGLARARSRSAAGARLWQR